MSESTRRIRGDTPRTFPVGARPGPDTLVEVYGQRYAGAVCTVPDGQVLVVPEYGAAPDCGPTTRHEYPAGTRFRVVRVGDARTRAVTDILTD